MKQLLAVAVFVTMPAVAAFAQGAPQAAGDPAAGKALWEGPGIECNRCHGGQGDGGFGPTLAGRNISFAAFERALRTPKLMPSYGPTHISDREATDMLAYMNSLPLPAQRGPLRVPVPDNAPAGQRVAIATLGCAQCHGPVFGSPRQALGAVNADFEWFKRMVYDHTTAMPEYLKATGQQSFFPRLVMGNYSRTTVQESLLRDMYDWARDLGVRANVAGRLSAGAPAANGVTYTVTVENAAVAGVGVAAEDLTVSLNVPSGLTVVSATGSGYQGTRRDNQTNSDAAVWQIPRLAAAERQTLTLTLSSAAAPPNAMRGTIIWTKPALKTGPVDTANIFPPGGRGGPPGGGPPPGGRGGPPGP